MKYCRKCQKDLPDNRFSQGRLVCKTCRELSRKPKAAPKKSVEVLFDEVIEDPHATAPIEALPPRPSEVKRFFYGSAPSQVLTQKKIRRVLFVPDTHAPYHSKRAWALMLKAARFFAPDTIVILGDFADFYSVSAHTKNPERPNALKYEVECTKELLSELNGLDASFKMYLCGNHEERLERYLSNSAPALFSSVKIEGVLGLAELGWHYTPYRESWKLGRLHLTHDTGPCGQNAHRQSMATFQGSAIIGHTHRMEYSVMGNADGPPQVGAMFGWLGDFEQVDYLHRVKAKRDWVHGFGVGIHDVETGVVYIQPVPIVNDSCCVMGEIVRL